MNQPKNGSSNEYDQTTPRLFRLRDLHSSKNVASPPSTVPDSVSSDPIQAPVTVAEESAFYGEPLAQAAPRKQDAAPSVTVDELAVGSHQQLRTRERIERHLDASPEGRSWMESAIAHRKVLVLLSIAISAAFWTSRGGPDQADLDPELAKVNGTLEFDPTQFDAGTLIDEGQDFFPTETSGDLLSQNLIANANDPAGNSQTIQLTPDQRSRSATGHEAAPVSAGAGETTAMASQLLVPNQTGDVAVSATSTDVGGHATGTASQIHSNGLTVTAVSSKTPSDPIFNAPSLDDLELAAMEAAPGQLGTELTLQNSDTPNRVIDWLKYLPPKQ